MAMTQFDRDLMASWYAQEHLKVDPGVRTIYYLRRNAPDREIRLLEVNVMMAERSDDALEPIDYGVDMGSNSEHKLVVLDVTPTQWELINEATIPLPKGWSLADAEVFHKP